MFPFLRIRVPTIWNRFTFTRQEKRTRKPILQLKIMDGILYAYQPQPAGIPPEPFAVSHNCGACYFTPAAVPGDRRQTFTSWDDAIGSARNRDCDLNYVTADIWPGPFTVDNDLIPVHICEAGMHLTDFYFVNEGCSVSFYLPTDTVIQFYGATFWDYSFEGYCVFDPVGLTCRGGPSREFFTIHRKTPIKDRDTYHLTTHTTNADNCPVSGLPPVSTLPTPPAKGISPTTYWKGKGITPTTTNHPTTPYKGYYKGKGMSMMSRRR